MKNFISVPEGEQIALANIEKAEDLFISYDRAPGEDKTVAQLGRFSKDEQKTEFLYSTVGTSVKVIEIISFYLAKELNKTLKSRVLHLARYSKSKKTRKKNKKRIYEHLKKYCKVTYSTTHERGCFENEN